MNIHRQSGYSLVELLVVLALLGFIAIAMSGGISFGTRAWEKSGVQVDAIERVEGAQNLLRTLLQRVVPRDLDPSNPVDLDLFRATRDRMSFTALSPSAIDANGLARFVLQVTEKAGKKQLNLSWTGVSGATLRQTQNLIVDASDISFAFAVLDQTGVFVWHDDWVEQSGAPALIAIRARFPAAVRAQWPELVIRPRISRDPSCVYDPVSFSCRQA
jgi:general secretion pathway protein J